MNILILAALLMGCNNNNNVSISNPYNKELFKAVAAGNALKLEGLIEKGADVNYIENGPLNNSESLLMRATFMGYIEVMLLLIKAGADVNYIDNAPFNNSESLLMTATFMGYIEVMSLLIQAGADVNYQRPVENHETALILATQAGNKKTVIELLKAPDINVNIADKLGKTALTYAKEKNYTSIVNLLQEHGAI